MGFISHDLVKSSVPLIPSIVGATWVLQMASIAFCAPARLETPARSPLATACCAALFMPSMNLSYTFSSPSGCVAFISSVRSGTPSGGRPS